MENLIEEFKAIKKELMTRKVSGEITTKQYNKSFQTSLQIYADKANMSKGAFGFETIKQVDKNDAREAWFPELSFVYLPGKWGAKFHC